MQALLIVETWHLNKNARRKDPRSNSPLEPHTTALRNSRALAQHISNAMHGCLDDIDVYGTQASQRKRPPEGTCIRLPTGPSQTSCIPDATPTKENLDQTSPPYLTQLPMTRAEHQHINRETYAEDNRGRLTMAAS